MTVSRRSFLSASAAGATSLVAATAVSGRVQAAAIPEAATTKDATMQPPFVPTTGPDYNPVVTLNGWTAPWRMNGDWKEFHLVAEPVIRELAPGMVALSGATTASRPARPSRRFEGDKVRIFVTNRLPEHTTVHWHGQLLPSGMDGVGGLTQPHIKPGKTFVYEFILRKSGTFMYHRTPTRWSRWPWA
ncbi:multicopper oxidase domain-containing protein [Chenggangzhangella methanolivorans]|uniref:multicopper oxidase domain-containing protein n=1 Tax=Chenggangzhangella methanolivorans TaxID=1437009 RepID=UPI003D163CD4